MVPAEWKRVSEGTGERGRDVDLGSGLPLLLSVGLLQIQRGPPHCPFSPFSLPKDTLSHRLGHTPQTEKVPEEGQAATVTTVPQPRCEACAQLSWEPWQHRMLTVETEAQAGWCPGHTARRRQPSPEALPLRLPGASGQHVG